MRKSESALAVERQREEAIKAASGDTDPAPIREDLQPINTLFIDLTGMMHNA